MPAYAEGDSAFNPATGQDAVFTGGKWVVQGSPQMPLAQGDGDALKELQTQANDAQWLAQKAQQFKSLQGSTNAPGLFGSIHSTVQTSPLFHEFGIPHIAEDLNPLPAIAATVDPRIDQLESISNQAWAHMRPSGSGGLKAPEIEGFQQAFPSIDHWGRVNNGIADRLQQDAETASDKLKYIDNFMRSGQGTYADANSAWLQRATTTPPPVDASKPLPGGPQPGTIEDGYQFKGGNPADPANWAQVQ